MTLVRHLRYAGDKNEEDLGGVQKYFQDQHQNEIIRQLGETARAANFITFNGKPVRKRPCKLSCSEDLW